MYDALIDRCAADGLRQYEIANFARDARVTRGAREVTPTPAPTASGTPTIPALACRHNVGYWRGRDYFGVGPSASEAIGGKRSKNWSNTNLWIERLERGRRAQEWSEGLTPLGRAGELAAFGLRMNAGWPFEEFQRRTGHDLRGEWRSNLDTLLQRGWAEETAEAFRLNRTGLRFADSAAEMMLR
jgi:oxygen-independent coproporphyrinogen-3 oxidase